MNATYELRSNGDYSVIFGPPGRGEVSREEFPTILAVTEASSWLAAKREFGFELTPLQTRILAGTATAFELFGHTQGWMDLTSLTRRPVPTRTYEPASPSAQAWKGGWSKEPS